MEKKVTIIGSYFDNNGILIVSIEENGNTEKVIIEGLEEAIENTCKNHPRGITPREFIKEYIPFHVGHEVTVTYIKKHSSGLQIVKIERGNNKGEDIDIGQVMTNLLKHEESLYQIWK